MGLIKAGMGALGGTLADQWKEFFYCDSLDKDVLMVKGQKRTSRRSSNNGEDNIITNGSGIAVADGQCMLIVEQGRVVEVCAEPGEFTFDAWEMKLRPLPAEETEGVMYYDPAATGERIQNLRKDREVTQEQLAIDLNISDRYMRNLEKGEKVPSVDLFVELRERFGSSLDYIVLGVSASQREQELQDQLQMLRKELKEMQRRILVMLEMLGESA